MEMAAGTLFIPAVLSFLLFNFIGPDKLFIIIPVFLFISLLNGIVFPYRFIRSVRIWSVLYSAFIFLFSSMIFRLVPDSRGILFSVTFAVAALYFVNEFEGWSPLVKFSMTGAYTSASIELSTSLCTGCGACVEVCPRGVFQIIDGKSKVIDPAKCCSCKSCFTQCPVGAIAHSAQSIDETL
ncbi:MAG: 4Fe-4S binding protein [Spirochaetales bacterium]|nr:4Fe-4S binding protein [Spirochaetales bacterium]